MPGYFHGVPSALGMGCSFLTDGCRVLTKDAKIQELIISVRRVCSSFVVSAAAFPARSGRQSVESAAGCARVPVIAVLPVLASNNQPVHQERACSARLLLRQAAVQLHWLLLLMGQVLFL